MDKTVLFFEYYQIYQLLLHKVNTGKKHLFLVIIKYIISNSPNCAIIAPQIASNTIPIASHNTQALILNNPFPFSF